MLRRVDLVRTDVSEELSASIIKVTRIGELGTTLAVTSNRRTLRRNTKGVDCEIYSATWNLCTDTAFATKVVYFRSVRRLLVTDNVVPCSPILVTLMMEALSSSEN
jgi:hypothetical protein